MDRINDDVAGAAQKLEWFGIEESYRDPALSRSRSASPATPTSRRDTDEKPPVCPSCLSLEYALFRPFDSHPPILNSYSLSPSHDHSPSSVPTTLPPRYLLIEYHDLLQTSSPSPPPDGSPNDSSPSPSCTYCPLLLKAITLFWDDDPSSYYLSKAPVADARSFRRILCLTQQPAVTSSSDEREGVGGTGGGGGTLCLFKALLYDDYPDATFPHALTVRDSTSRIEFYHYPWDLVNLKRAEEEGKGETREGEGNKLLEKEGSEGTDVGTSIAAEQPEESEEPEKIGEGKEENRKADVEGEDRKEKGGKGRDDGRKEAEQHWKSLPHPAIGTANHVPYAITLDRVVRLATRWLSQCDSSHPKCAPEPHQLPRRLLDLRSGVKLIDTTTDPNLNQSSSPPGPPQYMTLSHCWGLIHPLLTTTTTTLDFHLSQIHWSSLPLLFRDVILLVRELGCRYLWIDSLCILQDSESDWLTESANMSSIYAHATLNIAATAQRDASVEYFRTLKEPILSRAWVFQERLLSRRTLHFGSSEVLWECRSGCFCECGGIERGHVLSVRNLNNNAAASWRAPGTGSGRGGGDVESSGLLSPPLPLSRSSSFETGSSLTCGTIPKKVLFANLTSGSPETMKDSRLLHDFFLRCVEEYSFLSLTKELDRSFALAGIAKRIRSLLSPSDGYLAGLWLGDLPRALLWQPYRHKKVLRAGDNIPTWSWMSRSCYPVENLSGYGKGRGNPTASKCSVRYKHMTRSGYEFEVDDRLEVDPEKTWCEYEGDNEFGKLKGGQVTLRAAHRWGVVWTTDTKRSSGNEWTGRNNLVVAIGEGVLIPMAPDCPRQEDPKSVALLEKVLVVLFGGRKLDKEAGGDADGPQFFLALKEVEEREGVFQRIGFLESEWRIDLFENAEMPPRNSTMQPRADALVWLVTGCSSGFGLEFVLQIIARGDYVIATARDLSKHGVMQLSFDDVPLLQLDVTASQESLNEKIAEAIKIYGRIDVLVNNAGYVALGGWEDLGYDGFVKQFETNVFGLLKVTNAVLPQMRERRSGTLVFMSSLSGWKGDEFCGAYAASKFAVEGMVEALHEEVKPLGIRTLLFEPGKLRTKLLSPGNVLGNVSQIDDYKEESARVLRAFANVDSKQRGDPAKAVRIIMDVVRNQTIHPLTEEEYPVTFSPWGSECDEGDGRVKFRLPLGEDAYWTMKIKCEETLQMLSAWERVIASTDNMSTML
ncbi:hypothetical protein B0H65DRAFT_494879 [Neurospora tetraspora]|uniref:Heterokaryon incompatibility domain-containing protein n=1 Tax=Neurospora tetraspora TaxID=94610 RepID=A0AAE0JG50_9PEZI|nr:hypothetical protein B0H65DRAFT_494879 [Neurospora tetraspora]